MPKINREEEVKKDIEWLKREIPNLRGHVVIIDGVDEKWEPIITVSMKDVYKLIDQLDEPEITLDKAFEKVAESYLMTKEEIWRHLERLEAHGGKVSYEETEVKKDIEWLKNEINELPLRFLGFSTLKQREEFTVDKDDVLSLIDQLDEPETHQLKDKIKELEDYNNELIRDNNQLRDEIDNQETLSQEWIGEHSNGPSRSQYIWTDDLKELLVPKQDEREQLEVAYKDILERGEFWFDDKKYKVVEVEQKYYVMNNEKELLLSKNNDDEVITYSQYYPQVRKVLSDLSHYQLTEQEIKEYDERYFAFAVKVEELEE